MDGLVKTKERDSVSLTYYSPSDTFRQLPSRNHLQRSRLCGLALAATAGTITIIVGERREKRTDNINHHLRTHYHLYQLPP